ncbi:LPS-assembly protein LptD [Sulfidibacter corallicola]|uniref:LPS-assembly protein LptD n=1 Tax=Sulfidibacter corallicola TaxID=2818388 RepID=A0A8A4TPJ4_SULCO|nr:putative LPS assembly protein LptD [Sulfidibacter corallicola]QTD51470.1 LPS-assembly protein LptD [Sulfidibacter corallicola]
MTRRFSPAARFRSGLLLLLSVACSAPLSAQSSANQPDFRIEYLGSQIIDAEGKQIVTGEVKIAYGDLFLMTADTVVFNPKTNRTEASGNVKLDYYTELGLVEISAQRVEYDVANQSGLAMDVAAQFGDEFFFVGDSLEILNRGTFFIIEKGRVTACNQPVTHWSMEIRKAQVEQEGYAVIRGAKFRVKNIPIIYLPWMMVPVMRERRTGLLQPDTGSSERNGTFFSQPFYWAPRDDVDMTFTPTFADKSGLRLGLELRYRPNLNWYGELQGTYFRDDVLDAQSVEERPREDGEPLKKDRFRAQWHHEAPIWKGHFVVDVEAGSDFSVDRDYLQDAEKTRVRDYVYRARLDRPVGRDSLVLNVSRLSRILRTDETVVNLNVLPEFRYYQPKRRIAGGFYYRNQFYMDAFRLTDLGALQLSGNLTRLGMDAEISRPMELGRFIHSRWGVAARGAWYDGDLDNARNRETRAADGTLTELPLVEAEGDDGRGAAYAFLEFTGPRLRRDYRLGKRRLVHYLDANLDLRAGAADSRRTYAETMDQDPFLETLESIELDELDIRLNEQTDGLTSAWRVSNRLFTGPAGRVRPLAELEITQSVDLDREDSEDDDATAYQPIESRFRLLGLGFIHGNGFVEYNPDRGAFDALSFYGSVNKGGWRGYGGYVNRRARSANQVDQESFIGISELALPRWRSRLKLSVDYNFESSEFKSQEFLYGYQGQCVGFTVNYVRSRFDSSQTSNRDFFRLSVSLRNLGELGTKF